jgi:glycosyltransferase involved in cell wall biosynthesis
MIKISIVTVSYNQGKYLATAIRSILEQDYPAVEYIIVDPGSTDGSRETIERYSDRIHKIIFEPDNGPADGLNKGFAYATGDVLGYINSDDILFPGALHKVAAYFKLHQAIDVMIGNGVQLDGNGMVTKKLFSTKWDIRLFAYGVCVCIQPSTFFRKSAFEKAGGFNIENRTSWDGELLVDMAIAGARFVNVSDILGGFRLYPESISGSGRMNIEHKIYKEQIFKKIVGRDKKFTDKLWTLLYRLRKKLSSNLSRKVSDRPRIH